MYNIMFILCQVYISRMTVHVFNIFNVVIILQIFHLWESKK